MIKVQFSSVIDGVTAKKDRTLSVKLGTQELSPEDTSYLFDMMGKQVYVAVAETPVERLDVPEIEPEIRGEKTPSQRMRGVIYAIWEQKWKSKNIPFPKFYENYMSKLIEDLKDKHLS